MLDFNSSRKRAYAYLSAESVRRASEIARSTGAEVKRSPMGARNLGEFRLRVAWTGPRFPDNLAAERRFVALVNEAGLTLHLDHD